MGFLTIIHHHLGVFSKHPRGAISNLESGSLVFFSPHEVVGFMGLHEKKSTVLTSGHVGCMENPCLKTQNLPYIFQLQVTCRTVPYSIPTLKATMKKSTSFISSLLRSPVWGPPVPRASDKKSS